MKVRILFLVALLFLISCAEPVARKPKKHRTTNFYKEVIKKNTILDKFAATSFGKKKILVITCLLLFGVTLFKYQDVLFDKDISKMNYQSEELLSVEEELNTLINTSSKSLYVVTHDKTLDGALNRSHEAYKQFSALEQEGKVINFSTVSGIVIGKELQEKRLERWKQFWKQHKDTVKNKLIAEGTLYSFKPTTFRKFYNAKLPFIKILQ